jgi:hypothetical protein
MRVMAAITSWMAKFRDIVIANAQLCDDVVRYDCNATAGAISVRIMCKVDQEVAFHLKRAFTFYARGDRLPSTVVFNFFFCLRTPRCNFSSSLYPQSWCIIQIIHSL